jgi:hypothetical protein
VDVGQHSLESVAFVDKRNFAVVAVDAPITGVPRVLLVRDLDTSSALPRDRD